MNNIQTSANGNFTEIKITEDNQFVLYMGYCVEYPGTSCKTKEIVVDIKYYKTEKAAIKASDKYLSENN